MANRGTGVPECILGIHRQSGKTYYEVKWECPDKRWAAGERRVVTYEDESDVLGQAAYRPLIRDYRSRVRFDRGTSPVVISVPKKYGSSKRAEKQARKAKIAAMAAKKKGKTAKGVQSSPAGAGTPSHGVSQPSLATTNTPRTSPAETTGLTCVTPANIMTGVRARQPPAKASDELESLRVQYDHINHNIIADRSNYKGTPTPCQAPSGLREPTKSTRPFVLKSSVLDIQNQQLLVQHAARCKCAPEYQRDHDT